MNNNFFVFIIFFVGFILGRIDYYKLKNKKGLFMRTWQGVLIPLFYKKISKNNNGDY